MTPDDILGNFTAYVADAVMVSFKPADGDPKTVHVNSAFVEMFGWSQEEMTNGAASLAVNPGIAARMRSEVTQQLDAGKRSVSVELKCERKDKSTFWASLSVFAIPAEGGRYTTAVIRNIDDFKRYELDAERARADRDRLHDETTALEERLVAAINAIQHPLAIWDKDFRLVICNNAFGPRIAGTSRRIPKGTPLEDVLYRASRSGSFVDAIGREEEWLEEAVADIRSGPIRHITHYTDGKVYHAESHSSPNGDTLIVSTDITKLEAQRETLQEYAKALEDLNRDAQELARTDVVTGLGNRRFLEEALDRLTAERRETGGEIAALHIDLDRFKQINDTMGHAAGDHVLGVVAERLRDGVPDGAVPARVGGDEFVVLLPYDGSERQLEDTAHRLLDAIRQPAVFEGKTCRFGASIGVARTPIVDETALLTHSDIALYKAKQSGRGCVRSFRGADLETLRHHKSVADDILRGLERGEFRPVYQPQIDAATGRIVALEALARWYHPVHGVTAPALFLDPASELGVCDEIDRQIFEFALAECTGLFEGHADPPALAFNVGSRRLMSDGLLAAGEAAAIYPGQVSLELLETIFMDDDRPDFMRRLSALREMGFGIEVDDFGTGRASIIALQKIDPDRLKIDRKLIAPIVSSDRSRALVRSIIEIGTTLNIGITAEGVETADHADLLRDLGCDRLQGFYFARPSGLDCVMAPGDGAGKPDVSVQQSVA